MRNLLIALTMVLFGQPALAIDPLDTLNESTITLTSDIQLIDRRLQYATNSYTSEDYITTLLNLRDKLIQNLSLLNELKQKVHGGVAIGENNLLFIQVKVRDLHKNVELIIDDKENTPPNEFEVSGIPIKSNKESNPIPMTIVKIALRTAVVTFEESKKSEKYPEGDKKISLRVIKEQGGGSMVFTLPPTMLAQLKGGSATMRIDRMEELLGQGYWVEFPEFNIHGSQYTFYASEAVPQGWRRNTEKIALWRYPWLDGEEPFLERTTEFEWLDVLKVAPNLKIDPCKDTFLPAQ